MVAVAVVLVAPLLVTAVRVLFHGGPNPGGDIALIELRVRDVGSNTPLGGSYGRYGFNHPGPLWFYVLALPYRLLGSRFAGLQVGALLLSAASVVQVVVIAARRGGLVMLLWCAALVAVLVHGLGAAWPADPWEPHGLTLACAALLLLTFDAVAGRATALPVVAALASLLAQAQATLLAYAMAMLAVAAVAVGWRALRAREDEGAARRRGIRLVLVTAAVLAVLWAPPLIEELRHDPGNLTAMWRSLRAPAKTLGTGNGWRAVALELGPRAPWLGFNEPLQSFQGTVDVAAAPAVPVALVALLGGLALAAWRRREGRVLAAVVIVGVATAVVSLSHLLGPLFVWIPEWARVLGMGAWLAAGWCAYEALGPRARHHVLRFGAPILAVVVVAFSAASVGQAATDRRPADPLEVALHRLADDVAPIARAVGGPMLVRSTANVSLVFGGHGVGVETLTLALERAGVDVVVTRDVAYRFGSERGRPDRAVAELVLVESGAAVPDGFRVVSEVDPLTRAQRDDRAQTLAQIDALVPPGSSTPDILRAADRDPTLHALVDRLHALPDLPRFKMLFRETP